MPARPRPPEQLPPPLPPGTKYTDIMRPFHRDCQQAHKSTPLKPHYRCLLQTRETRRSSTGIDNPALSSTAVLSLCRHLTFPFCLNIAALHSTSLPRTRHRCLAQLRHKNHLGLQQAESPCTKRSCRSFTTLPTFIPFLPQHRCLHRHKSLIGLQRAKLLLHSARLLCFPSADNFIFARWRLRRFTHIEGMATDHDATARAARSMPTSFTVIKNALNAVVGARRSSASILEPPNPACIAGGRQPCQRQRLGGPQRLSFSLRQNTAPAQA